VGLLGVGNFHRNLVPDVHIGRQVESASLTHLEDSHNLGRI